MNKLKLDAGDFSFHSGKEHYFYDLPDSRVRVTIRMYSDTMTECTLQVRNSPNIIPLYSGIEMRMELDLRGVESIAFHAPKKAKLAICVDAAEFYDGEVLDPTPVAMTFATNKDLSLSQMVRMEIRKLLQKEGMDPDDADELDLTPLDGDYDDDELLEDLGERSPYQEMDEDGPEEDGDAGGADPADPPGDPDDQPPVDGDDSSEGGSSA